MGLGKVVLKRKLVFLPGLSEVSCFLLPARTTTATRSGLVGYLDLHGRLCLARRGLEGHDDFGLSGVVGELSITLYLGTRMSAWNRKAVSEEIETATGVTLSI